MIRLVRWLQLGVVGVVGVVCLPLLIVAAVVDVVSLRRRPDPVDVHYATAAALLAPDDLPDTLADEVEHWLCSQTCFRPIEEN